MVLFCGTARLRKCNISKQINIDSDEMWLEPVTKKKIDLPLYNYTFLK